MDGTPVARDERALIIEGHRFQTTDVHAVSVPAAARHDLTNCAQNFSYPTMELA
ncbi:MAG: hypothetical protein HY661_12320 [Betaproteobacteria bacterium]|nr:hypothetical protein [Betaproteobacteria bacterium]